MPAVVFETTNSATKYHHVRIWPLATVTFDSKSRLLMLMLKLWYKSNHTKSKQQHYILCRAGKKHIKKRYHQNRRFSQSLKWWLRRSNFDIDSTRKYSNFINQSSSICITLIGKKKWSETRWVVSESLAIESQRRIQMLWYCDLTLFEL